MRYITLALCALCLLPSSVLGETDVKRTENERAVVVPSELILPVVMFQPGCPLQFEGVSVLRYLNGGSADSYQLRNTGTMPIRDYTVAGYSSYGSFWTKSWPKKGTSKLLMPGQKTSADDNEDILEIVPLTDTLRDQLKLRGVMRGVTVFMIVSVEFADGTVYNNKPTKEALEAYFNIVSSKVP